MTGRSSMPVGSTLSPACRKDQDAQPTFPLLLFVQNCPHKFRWSCSRLKWAPVQKYFLIFAGGKNGEHFKDIFSQFWAECFRCFTISKITLMANHAECCHACFCLPKCDVKGKYCGDSYFTATGTVRQKLKAKTDWKWSFFLPNLFHPSPSNSFSESVKPVTWRNSHCPPTCHLQCGYNRTELPGLFQEVLRYLCSKKCFSLWSAIYVMHILKSI